MKRLKEIMVAYLKLNWYLLTQGMWKGECGYTVQHQNNHIVKIAAVKGSIRNFTFQVMKTFYEEQ